MKAGQFTSRSITRIARRIAWSVPVAACCFCAAVAVADKPSERPNVLFIAIDDLRPELGCYGQAAIRTPHIDKLAQSGVLFDRAYCQLAVCNPSRVSVMTGLRPDSTKVWDLKTRFRDTIPTAVTIPQLFMKQGYNAESFGKIFHNPWPDHQSWSEPHRWPQKSSLWSDQAKRRQARYRSKMRADGRPEKAIQRIRPQATEIVDIPDREHIDGAIAEQVIEAMKRLAERGQPFFLAAGFVRPHLPFVVPRKYWEMYDRDSIPLATNAFLPKDAPDFAMNTMYELRDYIDFDETPSPEKGPLPEAERRRLKHGYFASVSFIDSLVGKLLAQLDSLHLSDNTIVVLWSDHGWKLGEHNSWCKQTNYEIDTRVPLIIRSPEAASNGKRTDALVELVDVYPTLADLAGLPIAENLEGQSMASLLDDVDASWKEAAFSQFRRKNGREALMGYSMRTDRYRFIEWQNRQTRKVVATELYDHQRDPNENTNVSSLAKNAELVAELSHQMWVTLPKPPKVVAEKLPRPQITFENRRAEPVTLYWIAADGTERKQGVIQPGAKLLQKTTMGHRFILRSSNFTSRAFSVDSPKKKVVLATKPPGDASRDSTGSKRTERPNVVFCMADDWSWPHAGVLGDPVVKTPHFDRVAAEGVLFENAFVSTPSCTPSRLSILTGQHHWRLKEGDSLGGALRERYQVYTEMLQESGYRIGRFGKGVWPSKHEFRDRDSFGERFQSFDEFIKDQEPGKPFCFWHGGQDPHRPYELGVGRNSGINLDDVKVPACLPDRETVRSDVADYLWEVQRFDGEVGAIIDKLEEIGELENTIFVVSSDNGMPFPRCKATLYDQGTRVPLAVRWGKKVKGDRKIDDFVSLCDFAPTFLEAAGIKVPKEMTGRSLLPLLASQDSGQFDPERSFVLSGVERHVYSYPKRALRTKDFLFIRNFDSANWSTGEIEGKNPEYDFAENSWPTDSGAFSFAIDPSPTKQFLRLNREKSDVKSFADLSFAKRPAEELYDLRKDPDQLVNVAGDRAYWKTTRRLRQQLDAELIKSGDPRVDVDGYTSRAVEGWPVRVSDTLVAEKPDQTRRALELLEEQLRIVKKVIPQRTIGKIINVPIWFSPKYEGVRPTGEYHPGAGWLKSQGRRPELHQCVEFTNIPLFEREVKRMPVLVLHELAHAYHDQELGFDQAEIKATYDLARRSGSYESVQRGTSKKKEPAYAITNEREYFAETSEAYFGRNDFYPFDRKELQEHDPRMAELLKDLWNDTSAP